MAQAKPLRVLVATHEPRVLSVLEAQFKPYELIEALTTDGVRSNLLKVDLGIVDIADLAQASVRREDVWTMLQSHPIPVASSDDFLSNPIEWRQRALASAGVYEGLDKQVVLVTSYSGGVGKTSISIDVATHFAAMTHLPTVLLELTFGPSALRIITQDGMKVDLQQAATQNCALPAWKGISLVPYEHETCQALDEATVVAFFERLYTQYAMMVIDCAFPHPFLFYLQKFPKTVLVVGNPKMDAWAFASQLHERIVPSYLVMNMVGWQDKVVEYGSKRDLDLPFLSNFRTEAPDGRLAKAVLPMIYPGWRSK
jgi:hypothetical protein